MNTRNATVGAWQSYLTNRATRLRDGRFLIHGREPITRAVEHGWPLERLVYRLGAPELPRWARELIDTGGVPSTGLVPEVIAGLDEKAAGTPELVAVARTREMALDGFGPGAPGDRPVLVVLERPGSPVRLGAAIRAAHALGAAGVVLGGQGVDQYDPRCVRASAGALFALPVFRVPNVAAVRAFRDRQAARGIATDLIGVTAAEHAPRPLEEHDFARATIVMVADEAELGEAWRAGCDAMVAVPAGATLVAPCALAVVLYEISRQRRALHR